MLDQHTNDKNGRAQRAIRVYDTTKCDSMWLLAIKAFEPNKLRLFHIRFLHFGYAAVYTSLALPRANETEI